jgi:coenzyme F420 hydrogenase subunit delta
MLKEIYQKPRLIFGCGNPLFGDDGFGAEVVRFVEAFCDLPPDCEALDVGTAVREFLLDILLLEKRPSQIIIVDAMDIPRAAPGEIREISIRQIQPAKIGDFSLHQFPTVNMLKEIVLHTAIDVRILVVKPGKIPSKVKPGLSPPVKAAVADMCDHIMAILQQPAVPEAGASGATVAVRVGRLAETLGVHRNTVTNWIKSGKIKAQSTFGKKYLIREDELKKFFKRSGIEENVLYELV